MSSDTFDRSMGKHVAYGMIAVFVAPLVGVFAGAVAAFAMGPAALIVAFAAGFYTTYGLARPLDVHPRDRMIVSLISAAITCAAAVGLAFWVLSHADLG